jgi:hypothetical protein
VIVSDVHIAGPVDCYSARHAQSGIRNVPDRSVSQAHPADPPHIGDNQVTRRIQGQSSNELQRFLREYAGNGARL